MSISDQITMIDPNSIIIKRDERQRKELDVEALKDSIRRLGILHPAIITRDLVLIAGERRVTACRQLGIQMPVRFYDTLAPIELHIVELEENLKRVDLPWQDMVHATMRIHDLYTSSEEAWTFEKTAQRIGVDRSVVGKLLKVGENMDDPRVLESQGWQAAFNLIARGNARAGDVAMTTLMEETNIAFGGSLEETPPDEPKPEPKIKPDSIIHGNFLEWAPAYSGPTFNFIHCDFPYGINAFRPGGKIGSGSSVLNEYKDTEDTYTALLDCMLDNLDKLLSPSGHIMFWFSMQHFTRTRTKLYKAGLTIHPHPLIWVKSDNSGISSDPRRVPRHVYETALFAWRGERPIEKLVSDVCSAPTDKSIHPSAKPEEVLRHFFGMIVDGTTRMLDPTAGGGSAIRAAEHYSANYVFGIELDLEHVANANAAIRHARVLREIAR